MRGTSPQGHGQMCEGLGDCHRVLAVRGCPIHGGQDKATLPSRLGSAVNDDVSRMEATAWHGCNIQEAHRGVCSTEVLRICTQTL